MSKPRPGRPRLRLFVALELPADLLERLDSWRTVAYAELDALRLPARSSLHLTLVFLGYQYERDVGRLATLAFQPPYEPFELQAKGLVAVPPRRPRLHALALEDRSGALSNWQAGISQRLAEAGLYVPEKRPFWPHVTVARVKRGREREADAVELPQPPDALAAPFQASQATLYSSKLSPAGATYEALASIELSV